MPSHHHEEHESSSNKLVGCDSEIYHNCDNHSLHDPFWYNHDTPPPETASSIQSLLLNGDSTEETRCEDHHACCTEWAVDDDREYEGHDGCQEHRGPLSPSIMIPGMLISVRFGDCREHTGCYDIMSPPLGQLAWRGLLSIKWLIIIKHNMCFFRRKECGHGSSTIFSFE